MFRTARKNLWAHKLRLALTALAVILGVAFMAGTLVLTSTLKRNIDSLFIQSAANYTAVVRATTPYSISNGPGGGGGGGFGGNNRPLTPQSVLDTVRSTPGVAAADGVVQGQVTLVGSNGKAVKPKTGAPTLAIGWVPDHQLSQFKLRTGRAPTNDGDLVVDANTAKTDHVGIGTRLTVDSNVAPEQFTVVGTFGFGSSATIAGATIVAFDTATAQRLVGKAGSYQQIDVLATPGTSTDTLLNAIGGRIPSGYEAISSSTAANQMASQVNKFISRFNTFLLVFAFIALFVGAFLIFNTFSILVGQRTRELALFRALGASRGQVTGSVVLEALLTGLAGSIIGLGAGVLLASGLLSFLRSYLSLNSSGLVLTAGTVVVALVVGTVITVLSALGPAVKSSRVPPVAAMRDDVVIAESSLRRRATIGAVVLIIGVVALAAGLFGSGSIGLVGLGAALTFLGVAMLLPFIAAPLARFIGAPLTVTGITGRLSQENSARNPRRTAATSAALMIGLAVVAAIATLASSATASFGALFTATVKADYVITTNGDGFSKQVEPVIRSAPGVIAISPFTEVQFHIGKAAHVMAALDPVTGPQLADIHMISGSTSALAAGEILVDDKVAKSDHYAVGTKIPMGFGSTGVRDYTVGGTYKTNQLLDSYLGSTSIATANSNQPVDEAILIKVGKPSRTAQDALSTAIAGYPQLSVKTAAQYVDAQKNQITGFLRFVYVLLAFSILIALIGVVNTLVLSVLERTHEIGLLRAIGMIRRQVRSMIRGEAVVVSVLGAVLGLALGVGFGAAIVTSLSSQGIGKLVIPVSTIVVVLVLALLFGIFAAIFPARRAARLDVLRAISAT